MEPSYVGAIWMWGGNFAPRNFAFCNGQLMSIAENEVLYTLIGTTYGGDGVQTFGIPDIRGRSVLGQGQGPGLNNYVMGQVSGTEQVTMTSSTMPSHTHFINVSSANGSSQNPSSSSYIAQPVEGSTPVKFYNSAATVTAQLNPQSVGMAGNSVPFSILQPVLAVSYVISLFGIFPSQN